MGDGFFWDRDEPNLVADAAAAVECRHCHGEVALRLQIKLLGDPEELGIDVRLDTP
jgi:hypothetical protein